MENEHGSSKLMPKSTYCSPCNKSSKRRKTENSASAEVKIRNNRKSGLKTSDINVENGVDREEQQKYCHQCRKGKYGAVQCNKCQSKTFCFGCRTKWYPNVSKEEFVEACPVCRNNCNCKACLRGPSPKLMQAMPGYSCSKSDRIRYSKYILQKGFSHVRRLNDAQVTEKQTEATVQGLSLSDLQIQDAKCDIDDDIYCDKCGAYIFDLYRSCACGYDLCLLCCQDLRDGCQGLRNGSSRCPPKDIGGCGVGILDLKQIMAADWVANTFKKARTIYKINTTDEIQQVSLKSCICNDPSKETVGDSGKSRKEATQEKANASYLYSLSAVDIQSRDMHHFQLHWSKGEPVIVHDVLSTSSGLSWEPMVLWRAFRDITKSHNHSQLYEVNTVNCLDWVEVTIDLHKFFRGYLESGTARERQSMILKLQDWKPPQEEWQRHFLESISCLPFKDYTHPNGYLNVAAKLPDLSLKPEMGPRLDIAYGGSVTRLHYKKSDTINVLTHTKSSKLGDHDKALVYKEGEGLQTNGDEHVVDPAMEAVVWDIFRRQDIPKLEKYLTNHSAEFPHVGQVLHPIHDRTFYLNTEHKRRLKEEFGIEPWTFEQRLGDAVLIPAGCPCQVRNLKSSTKVELNFVSPESLEECIRLQHELCTLPYNHSAKKEKLNIGKMMLYALDNAVTDLEGMEDLDMCIADLQFAKGPVILDGDDANHTNGWLSCTPGDDESQRETGSVFLSSSPLGPPALEVNHTVDQEPAALEDSGTSKPTDEGLWRGHAVGPEPKKILQAIEHRYPNTFHGVHIRSKTIWLSILKEFHVVIKGFLETSAVEVAEEQITNLHEDLKEFERFGFDLSWAHERLDMVEKLKFGNDPLRQELMALEECLEPLKERVVERRKQFVEANEMLKKARLAYRSAKEARNEKAREVAERFGSEYDRVLTGNIGFGMLPD